MVKPIRALSRRFRKPGNQKFYMGVRVSSTTMGPSTKTAPHKKKRLGFTMGTNQFRGGFEQRAYPFGENMNGSYPFLHRESLKPFSPMPLTELFVSRTILQIASIITSLFYVYTGEIMSVCIYIYTYIWAVYTLISTCLACLYINTHISSPSIH